MTKNTDSHPRVLVLYTELAQYIVSCIERFSERNNASVVIVRWPVNKEAPFEFKFSSAIKVHTRSDLSDNDLMSLASGFDPHLILSSGWVDRGYLGICRKFKKKGVPTVMCTDTKWVASLKQKAAVLLSPLLAGRSYTDVWTTGKAQGEYAKRLGFPADHIHYGFYSADAERFKKNRALLQEAKATDFPKRFLYMGRYIESKGIQELVSTFIEIQEENPNEWELWCCGTGDLDPLPMEHPSVRHFGFVQVKDVHKFIEKTGVFVLPSHFEPWGVVVHEMAASGMPMLLSSEVGAGELFLEEGNNGYTFGTRDQAALKNGLLRFMALNGQELLEMAQHSAELGLRHDTDKWSETLESIIDR